MQYYYEGDEAKTIEKNQGLVVSIANKHRHPRIDFLDLLQEGNLGLLKATRKFDPGRGLRFSTYANFWIKAAILRAIRDQGTAIRIPNHVHDILATAFSKKDSSVGVKYKTFATKGYFKHDEASLMERTRKYLSQDNDLTTDLRGLENSPNQDDTFKAVSNKLLLAKLLAKINTLKLREKEVLKFRFQLTGERKHTFKEIAESLGIAAQRAHQIEKEALNKLRYAFAEEHCGCRAVA